MRLAIVTLALLSLSPAIACTPTPLCAFDGDWTVDGAAFGRPARVSMRWEEALGGAYRRILYRIDPEAGADAFEGEGYYRPTGDGGFDGTWFDSQGAMHPLKAQFAESTLTTYWGAESGTYGRTTYRLVAEDAVEIVDAIRAKDGAWREFSRNTLRRANRD